jgi:mRNA-degrading endonuclease toxin of MazEF toxin-antitoxin module
MGAQPKFPHRGEIWFVKLPTDPRGKGARPVAIVSTDDRNLHPRADTVLVVPLTTSVTKDRTTHLYLSPGETGLEQSVLKAEDIAVVPKSELREPRFRLRPLSNHRICELVEKIRYAMGC